MQQHAITPAPADHEQPGLLRVELGKADKAIDTVDGVLLDTLGEKGSMFTGALVGFGVGLAIGDVIGAVIGLVGGLGFGALGALGRTHHS
jgi:hypothetical protein